MLDIFYNKDDLIIKNSDKKEITFKTSDLSVFIDGFDVTYSGEYEKSGILLEVKYYSERLFYNFLVDGKHLVIVPYDSFEIKEDILDFFGDVDILVITGTKDAAKVFENIEAKMVIPYGEGKDVFLNTLGQNIEEVSEYKVKADLPIDLTVFVNLGK